MLSCPFYAQLKVWHGPSSLRKCCMAEFTYLDTILVMNSVVWAAEFHSRRFGWRVVRDSIFLCLLLALSLCACDRWWGVVILTSFEIQFRVLFVWDSDWEVSEKGQLNSALQNYYGLLRHVIEQELFIKNKTICNPSPQYYILWWWIIVERTPSR